MKIYSDVLTMDDLRHAAARIPAVEMRPGAHLIEGRKRRFEGVTIRGITAERPKDWRDHDDSACGGGPMGGNRSMPQNATYNEHGRWMALLFDIDPDARIKSSVNDFQGRRDFHRQTGYKYDTATYWGARHGRAS